MLLSVVLVTTLQCQKDSASANTTGSGGSTARFAIYGDYLYIVDKENLKVFNIADVANPVLKNTVPVGFEIETRPIAHLSGAPDPLIMASGYDCS